MIHGSEELTMVLLRTTGLLALSALAVRGVLGRLRPVSPGLWRLACALVLLQGVLFVRVPVKIPRVVSMSRPVAIPASPLDAVRPPAPQPQPGPSLNPAERTSASVIVPATLRDPKQPIPSSWAWSWTDLLVTGWLAGIVALPAFLLVGYARFVFDIRSARPGEPAWAEEWSTLLSEHRVRRGIPLRVTDRLGPMLCRVPGGYRLIVPEWLWKDLDREERLAILRHELAHYLRGDVWKSLAVRTLALPHWFNPFAWWAVRTFDECGEWACDDRAADLEAGRGSATAYARALLRLVEGGGGDRRPLYGASARGSSLTTRIRRLMGSESHADSKRKTLCVAAVAVVLVACHLIRPEWSSRAAEPPSTSKVDLYGDPLPAGASARLGTVRFRPGHSVERLAFSPDGKTLTCWDSSSTLIQFDAATGKPLRTVHFPRVGLDMLSYLPGGKSLALISTRDLGSYLWDFANAAEPVPAVPSEPDTFERVRGLDYEKFRVFAASPDGKLLAGGSDGSNDRDRMIRLWNLETGKTLGELKIRRDFERRPGRVLWLAFSPDGRSILSLSGDDGRSPNSFNKGGTGILHRWDSITGAELGHWEVPLPMMQGVRRGMGISPDGRLLAIGAPSKTIHLIDPAGGAELRQIETPAGASIALAFSPDGKRLLSGGQDQAVRTWDVATGRPLGGPVRHRSWVEAIAFAPDGRSVASGGQDSLIRHWDVASGNDLNELPAPAYWITSLALSRDGATAVTASWNDPIRIWDGATGRHRRIIGEAGGTTPLRVHTVALAPDGKTLATSVNEQDAPIQLYDLTTGGEVRKLARQEGKRPIGGLAFSQDGKYLLSTSNEKRSVTIWDVVTGQPVRTINHGETETMSITAALSPDGLILASAGHDKFMGGPANVIRLWDSITGRQLRELRGPKGGINILGFSPDGKWLLSGGISTNSGLAVKGGGSVASPDHSDSVHLWDVATGADLLQYPAENSDGFRNVNAIAFTPDGRNFITGEDDGRMLIYDVKTDLPRGTLRGHSNGVRAVAISADGRRLVSVSLDLTGLVWDLPTILAGSGGG